jgi:hypothetical protein
MADAVEWQREVLPKNVLVGVSRAGVSASGRASVVCERVRGCSSHFAFSQVAEVCTKKRIAWKTRVAVAQLPDRRVANVLQSCLCSTGPNGWLHGHRAKLPACAQLLLTSKPSCAFVELVPGRLGGLLCWVQAGWVQADREPAQAPTPQPISDIATGFQRSPCNSASELPAERAAGWPTSRSSTARTSTSTPPRTTRSRISSSGPRKSTGCCGSSCRTCPRAPRAWTLAAVGTDARAGESRQPQALRQDLLPPADLEVHHPPAGTGTLAALLAARLPSATVVRAPLAAAARRRRSPPPPPLAAAAAARRRRRRRRRRCCCCCCCCPKPRGAGPCG